MPDVESADETPAIGSPVLFTKVVATKVIVLSVSTAVPPGTPSAAGETAGRPATSVYWKVEPLALVMVKLPL